MSSPCSVEGEETAGSGDDSAYAQPEATAVGKGDSSTAPAGEPEAIHVAALEADMGGAVANESPSQAAKHDKETEVNPTLRPGFLLKVLSFPHIPLCSPYGFADPYEFGSRKGHCRRKVALHSGQQKFGLLMFGMRNDARISAFHYQLLPKSNSRHPKRLTWRSVLS